MYNNNFYKRLRFSIVFLSIIISLLVGRLIIIQIVLGSKYEKMAKEQREVDFTFYPDRGTIFDRNLVPLTNNKTEKTMFVLKSSIDNINDAKEFIKSHSNLSTKDINNLFNSDERKLEIPVSKDKEDINSYVRGIAIVDKTFRYSDENILTHVIGYNIGDDNNYGIESYDDILKTEDPRIGKMAFTVDGRGKIIPGLEAVPVINNSNKKPKNIKLTIDYRMQKIVEDSLDKKNYNGAIIVNDVSTGDILAMASRPNFNPNKLEDYLDGKNGELINKAIQYHYSPGSIFKIVVLLSALENKEIDFDEKFFCNGKIDVYGKTFHCHKEEGHGEINIKDAFANSCNSVFIEIGKRLGGERIINTAKKIGFEEKLGIGLVEEITGSLPHSDFLLGPAIGNISLGQGSIEVTPIQVSNMMTIIANNGIMKDLSIIKDSVVTDDGETKKTYNREDDIRKVLESDALKIKEFLEEVLITGTGKSIDLDDVGGAAGKTGSAQWGANNSRTNGWFSGYFPRDKPKYVITIIIEDGGYASTSALPIFEEIAKEIWSLEK